MRLLYFEGQLFLARGVAERLVAAPHDPNPSIGANQRNVPPDLLLFDNGNAARFLDRDGVFDAAIMPTSLRFERLEILRAYPDKHYLVIDSTNDVVEQQITPGESVRLADRIFLVEDIVPWEGLLRHPSGQAMATVVLRTTENSREQRLFLQTGAWNYLTGDVAIQFQWHANESTARAAAAATRDALQTQARLGVRDGEAIQWLQGLAPGSGLTLRNGGRVSFVKHAPDKRSIYVLIESGGEKRRVEVPVNEFLEDSEVYYQDPSQAAHITIVHAWEEGQALIQYMGSQKISELRVLHEGDTWSSQGGQHLQLEQVLAHAIPVSASVGQISAVRLSYDGRKYTLREGLVKTIDTIRMEYRRKPQSPDAVVHLSALDEAGLLRSEIALGTHASERLGNWLFSVDDSALPTRDRVILKAVRRPGGWSFYLGCALFAAGCVGWVFVRGRQEVGHSCPT